MNTCPQCKLINPPDAVLCDCGYDFSTGKGGLKQPRFLFNPRVVRNIGITLFALSFPAPGSWKPGGGLFVCGGFAAFLVTPIAAFQNIKMDAGSCIRILMTIAFLLSWGANFTIFFRLPLRATLMAILLPWCIYVMRFPGFVGFFAFYPWAFGIAIIHLSKLMEPKQKGYQRTS